MTQHNNLINGEWLAGISTSASEILARREELGILLAREEGKTSVCFLDGHRIVVLR